MTSRRAGPRAATGHSVGSGASSAQLERDRPVKPQRGAVGGVGSRTRLSALITRAVGWSGVLVAVSGGALSLASTVGEGISTPREPAPVVATGPVGAEEAAGSFATGYVGAWLEATEKNPGRLEQYLATENLALPTGATAYRDLVVSSISYDEPGGLVAVLIGATVEEKDPQGPPRWINRYFQITLNAQGGLSVVGLPAPVAAPAPASAPPPLAYDRAVASSAQIHQDIASFLAAYATGQGELARYITPESSLAPITPAPYEQVRLTSITSVGEVPDAADTGAVAQVLVNARLGTEEAAVPATYALSVVSREGRWEVSTVDARPKVAVPPTESEN